MTQKKKYYQISSLEKGMAILELLAENGELGVSEAARMMDMNRAGCHRFIATLKDMGYVEKNSNNKYQATLKIMKLAKRVLGQFEISKVARPYMHKLSIEFKETVNLGFLKNHGIVHLDKIDSLEVLRMDTALGDTAPAYCTSLGKAILAFLPDHELAHYLENVRLKRLTPNTITRKKELKAELARVRENRFAIDDEELAIGLRCVAVPILNHHSYPAYAMSVSGPAMRLTHRTIEKIRPILLKVSADLSDQMGTP